MHDRFRSTNRATLSHRFCALACAAALACPMAPAAAQAASVDMSYGGSSTGDTRVGIRLAAQQLSVDAPVRITVEGDDHAAFDVDKIGAEDGYGASSGKVTFVNRSERAAYLAGATVTQDAQANVGKVFQGSVGSDAKPFMKITAGATTGQVSTVSKEANSTSMVFDISDPYSGGRRDFYLEKAARTSFDLAFDVSTGNPNDNLAQSSLKGNTTPIASVIWTFGAIPNEPAFDGAGKQTDSFYLSVSDALSYEDPYKRLDPYKGKTYSLDEVSGMADCLSRFEDVSLYYGAFNIMCGPASEAYTCRVAWDSSYDVRIIGVIHDDLADVDENKAAIAEGCKKAGLTFKFKGNLEGKWSMNSSDTADYGWGGTQVRANLNPDYLPNKDGVVNGTDTNMFWDKIPSAQQTAFKVVSKPYSSSWFGPGEEEHIDDKVFLPSRWELCGAAGSKAPANGDTTFTWVANLEGNQYALYRNKGVSMYSESYPILMNDIPWFTRSRMYSYGQHFMIVTNGNPSHHISARDEHSISPCFCL